MLDTHALELLQKCEWIDEPKNLLITGSARAGKTYIANALNIPLRRSRDSGVAGATCPELGCHQFYD
jgi:DNA replication protein DnaC